MSGGTIAYNIIPTIFEDVEGLSFSGVVNWLEKGVMGNEESKRDLRA